KKDRSKSSPNPFIPLVRRLQREIEALEEKTVKPTIWIDQDSMGQMKRSQSEQYDKYKAKNISLKGANQDSIGNQTNLVDVYSLSLGYDKPLFSGVNFQLRAGERLQIVGRNGAGKTTLVDALCAVVSEEELSCKIFDGVIDPSPKLVIGRYEQEMAGRYLDDTLGEAITKVYRAVDRQVNEEIIFQLLNEFLFERHDGNTPVRQLSGGQKARLQLISLFASRPNLLILDEPTNHLDLPSIEELENALKRYDGAILYISHDSYFASNLGGDVVRVGAEYLPKP
ncbi:MAG: ATP-binding cassette domain-containing protein, partial [bacterium]